MSVMGEWIRHLDELIDALAASDRSGREDLVNALSQARPTDLLDLNNSVARVRKILQQGDLIENEESNIPAGPSRRVAEEAEIVDSLARIIRGD